MDGVYEIIRDVLLTMVIGFVVFFLLFRLRYLWKKPKFTRKHNIHTFPYRTGDVIITCERIKTIRGAISPEGLIKCFTSSCANHTAIVYVHPITGEVLFWELNASGPRLAKIYDLTNGKKNHDILIRQLNKPVDNSLFEETVRRQYNYIFNFDISLDWYNRFSFSPLLPIPFLKGYDWSGGKQHTCAHATTEMYHSLGVMNFNGSGINPGSTFASDYIKEAVDKRILPLTNGYKFGPVIKLDFKPSKKNKFE